MNDVVIIDASIAMTRIRRQAGWEDVNARLAAWQTGGTSLLVPSHFWLEVSNGLTRRHRHTGRHVVEAIHRLDEIGLTTVEVDRPMLLLAVDRAERFVLTTYDAAYHALAESRDAMLFSTDRALLAAAGPRGVSPTDFGDHRLSEAPVAYGVERRSTWPDYSGASAYLAKLRSEATRPS
jgi:predicted nucleic acid-binding protein